MRLAPGKGSGPLVGEAENRLRDPRTPSFRVGSWEGKEVGHIPTELEISHVLLYHPLSHFRCFTPHFWNPREGFLIKVKSEPDFEGWAEFR